MLSGHLSDIVCPIGFGMGPYHQTSKMVVITKMAVVMSSWIPDTWNHNWPLSLEFKVTAEVIEVKFAIWGK
jgi:hypothetical protein